MPFRAVSLCSVVLAAFMLAACTGLDKSENVLSPTVAGPIPGVNISPPTPLGPKDGLYIAVESQPITLLIENAATNGERPLNYSFEVATDVNFNTTIITRDGVAPGDGGRTSFRLPDALPSARTYYWRAKAQDGANTGPYSGFVHFNVFTPIVIEKPIARAPINNVLLDSALPRFSIDNAPRSGPVGPISYIIEVAGSDSFADRYVIWTVGEQPGQTSLTAPSPLPSGKQLFWRTRASDGGNQGPWSDTQVFRTPAPPAPPVTPGNGTGGHIPSGPATVDRARQVVLGTGNEFPSLTAPRGSDAESEAAGTQLMLRMIWHLQLAGFSAGRQRNPSGAISPDKLTVFADGAWHAYDVFSTRPPGTPLDVHFDEVGSPNSIADPGIPD